MATIVTPAASKIAKMIARRAPGQPPANPEKAILNGPVADLMRNFDAKRFIGFMPVLSRRDLWPTLLKKVTALLLLQRDSSHDSDRLTRVAWHQSARLANSVGVEFSIPIRDFL